MIHKKGARVLAATGMLAGSLLLLTGCANPFDKALEQITSLAPDEIVSGITDTEVDGLLGTEIPADFPSSIPLPDLTPVSAIGLTTDGTRGWAIQYQIGADVSAYDETVAQMVASGFTKDDSTNLESVMMLTLLSNNEYGINLGVLGSAEEDRIFQIMVSELAQ